PADEPSASPTYSAACDQVDCVRYLIAVEKLAATGNQQHIGGPQRTAKRLRICGYEWLLAWSLPPQAPGEPSADPVKCGVDSGHRNLRNGSYLTRTRATLSAHTPASKIASTSVTLLSREYRWLPVRRTRTAWLQRRAVYRRRAKR